MKRAPQTSSKEVVLVEEGDSRPLCPIPYTEMVIFADGTVSPCCNFFDLQFANKSEKRTWVGDAKEQEIGTIWREGFSSLRKSMYGKKALSATCEECSNDMRHRRDKWPESFWLRMFGKFRKRGEFEKAISFVTDQLEKHPGRPILHFQLGRFQMDAGEHRTAIEHLERATELDTGLALEDTALAFELLGICHMELEEWTRATKHFRRSLKLSQGSERARILLAKCLFAEGHHEEVLDLLGDDGSLMYSEAHMLDALRLVARTLARQGRIDEVHAHLEYVRTIEASIEAGDDWGDQFYREICRKFWENQTYGEGISFCSKELLTQPQDTTLLHYLGVFHMERGELDTAIEHFRQVLHLQPDLPESRFQLWNCLMKNGAYEEALDSIQKNLDQCEDSIERAKGWEWKALCHVYMNQPGMVSICLTQAREVGDGLAPSEAVDTTWPSGFFQDACEHFRDQGLYREGIRFCLSQLREYPEHSILHLRLGEFSMELEEYGQARDHLEKAIKLDQEHPESWHLLWKALIALGALEEALTSISERLGKVTNPEERFQCWMFTASCQLKQNRTRVMRESLEQAKTCINRERKGTVQVNVVVDDWLTAFFTEACGHFRQHDQYVEGIAFATQLLDLYPDSPLLSHFIGEFHMELGEFEQAVLHLENAIEKNPLLEWTRFSLGKCFYLLGDSTKAEKSLSQNLEVTRNRLSHFHSLLLLAMIMDRQGDSYRRDEFLQQLEVFKDLLGEMIGMEVEFTEDLANRLELPDWMDRVLQMTDLRVHDIFNYYRSEEKFQEGIAFGKRQLRRYPESVTIHNHLGEFYMDLEEYGTAIEHLERTIELDPSRRRARIRLWKCLLELGSHPDAIKSIQECLSDFMEDEERLQALIVLACHLLREGKQFELESTLAETSELADKMGKSQVVDAAWGYFLHSAFGYFRKNEKYAEAIEFGEGELIRHTHQGYINHQVGECHMEMGEYKKAIIKLREALEKDSSLEWVRFSLGKCLFLLGRTREAEQYFKEELADCQERVIKFHSLLFLAMCADKQQKLERREAHLEQLESFKDLFGEMIPLEKRFMDQQ